MAEVIKMPKLSDTMTEGVVANWLKKPGDTVKSGDILAEIETDKATMEFESFFDGVLLHIGVAKGKAAPVDTLLCVIGQEGEDISELLKNAADNNQSVRKTEAFSDGGQKAVTPPQLITQVVKPVNPVNVKESLIENGTRLKISPLAKKLAGEKGINPQLLKGSGDGGRIVKRDVEGFSGLSLPVQQVESYEEVTVSQMRKTIARRLAESKFNAPHFYLTVDMDMEPVIHAKESLQRALGIKISYNDMVIKAASVALTQHPAVNASWLGDRIRYNHHVHMGVAVAVDEGLLVPVVRFANTKTLSQINTEVKELAEKARSKKLQPQEWEGNTFTVSNLGMFGIDEFTAIINPPDACIMAVGSIRQEAVVKNGQVAPGHRMKVTLSCDHRVVDGATAAGFLQTFKNWMENPVALLGQGSV